MRDFCVCMFGKVRRCCCRRCLLRSCLFFFFFSTIVSFKIPPFIADCLNLSDTNMAGVAKGTGLQLNTWIVVALPQHNNRFWRVFLSNGKISRVSESNQGAFECGGEKQSFCTKISHSDTIQHHNRKHNFESECRMFRVYCFRCRYLIASNGTRNHFMVSIQSNHWFENKNRNKQ